MSDPTDIKALDEYLKGDSDVSRGYRELGRDEVPPELDRRVLAAARDAVANEGTQRSRSWLRWSAPIALAASVVLVVTVVLERGPQDELVAVPAAAPAEPQQSGLSRDKDDDYAAAERKLADEMRRQRAANAQESAPVYVQPVTQAPPPALVMPADVAEPASAVVTAAKAEVRPVVPPPDLALEEQASQTMAAVPEAPAAAPQPEPAQRNESSARESATLNKVEADDTATGVEETSVSGIRTRRGPGRTAGSRGTISTMSGAASESRPASDDERADRSDPEAWLEDIRDLRRAGKSVDADREWDLFHKAFPDFHVADDDLARKKP